MRAAPIVELARAYGLHPRLWLLLRGNLLWRGKGRGEFQEKKNFVARSTKMRSASLNWQRLLWATVKETVQRVTNWAVYYHTSRRSWYPTPESALFLSQVSRCGFGIREKNSMPFAVFWHISVRFCGFRTPLTPPSRNDHAYSFHQGFIIGTNKDEYECVFFFRPRAHDVDIAHCPSVPRSTPGVGWFLSFFLFF